MSDNTTQHQSAFRQLVRCSQIAKELKNWLVGRHRRTNITKVRVASQNTGASYGEIVALFKLLEMLGFGEFVEGRHGRESRMLWCIDIKSLAQTV